MLLQKQSPGKGDILPRLGCGCAWQPAILWSYQL